VTPDRLVTRRRFLVQTGFAAALLFASAGFLGLPAAHAQERVSVEELMQPGPLPEKSEGSPDAPVTMIEYASMTCSHCASFQVNTLPRLKSEYIDTGKVRLILREFPLDPLAAAGFMLARCAPNDSYFAFVDTLFHRQAEWAFVDDPVAALEKLSLQAGFTHESFNECLTNQKLLDGINAVRDRAANEFGVNSTPTFFINGQVKRGDMSFEELKAILDPLLNS